MSDDFKTALAQAELALTALDNPRLEAEYLLSAVMKKPRSFFRAFSETMLSAEQSIHFNDYVTRRAQGEPRAYILGQKEFWGLNFSVTPAVLIPRPETELLVAAVLKYLPSSRRSRPMCLPQGEHAGSPLPTSSDPAGDEDLISIADLGTGSGAIAIALASERLTWQITAVDNSSAVLNIAQKNAECLAFNNIEFVESDWYQALDGRKFTAIVSNPPYIDQCDPAVSADVRHFEPAAALFAQEQGLAALKQIIEQAPTHLSPRGWLFLEHGYQQQEIVCDILLQHHFSIIERGSDLAGLPRYVVARL